MEFFEGKHHYPIYYVGNPTADEAREYKNSLNPNPSPTEEGSGDSAESINGKSDSPLSNWRETGGEAGRLIAILAGSRRQEIKENLPAMIRAAQRFQAEGYKLVLAGAPSIDDDYYQPFIENTDVRLVKNQTYALLSQAHAALVTSGTATLETALFHVPQVVCYRTAMPRFYGWLRKKLLKVKYISLVNLIADREVVCELVADSFSEENIERELAAILPDDSPHRLAMLEGYNDVSRRLGDKCAPDNAASLMIELLRNRK